jgi:hypothetical protein
MKTKTTETIVIGGTLLIAAAIRIIFTDLIAPLAALLLALAGWRPAPSTAAALVPAVEPPRPLALAPAPVVAPAAFPTPRAVLESANVRILRRMAQTQGISRDVYNFARKPELIQAIMAATSDGGGSSRASG